MKYTPIGYRFVIWWILANTIGLGLSLAFTLSTQAETLVNWIIGFTITGYLFGRFQSIVLKRQIEVKYWGWCTGIAWTVGIITGSLLEAKIGGVTGTILLWVTLGTCLGIAQLFDLNQHIYYPGWWVLVSIISITAALLVGSLINGLASFLTEDFPYLFGFPVAGAVYGLLTGIYLAWIINYSRLRIHSFLYDRK